MTFPRDGRPRGEKGFATPRSKALAIILGGN